MLAIHLHWASQNRSVETMVSNLHFLLPNVFFVCVGLILFLHVNLEAFLHRRIIIQF